MERIRRYSCLKTNEYDVPFALFNNDGIILQFHLYFHFDTIYAGADVLFYIMYEMFKSNYYL